MSLLFLYMGAYNYSDIARKIEQNERIVPQEALWLAEHIDISRLGKLAAIRNNQLNGQQVFFNRNIHIEPTNVCINHCLFCSYRRRKGERESWEYSIEKMLQIAENALQKDPKITELHIVGGVHPDRDLHFYTSLLKQIRKTYPKIHIKAFTAEEIVQMCNLAKISIQKGIEKLINSGLNSVPGGGAEIFDTTIRQKICPDKISGKQWIEVHKTAHHSGIPSNATMLYGHYDKMEHRIAHMDALRKLQDKTNGFNAFIPLKFKSQNNKMSHLGEVSMLEDLKTFSIARLFLDNIHHLKAYWPMLGLEETLLLLQFGVDDIDGTIDDSTKIYSMAGGQEKPAMSSHQLVEYISDNQRIAVERDSVYNVLKIYE